MDTDLWLKLLKNGKARFIPHVMAYIRSHSDSKSCNKKLSDIKESQEVFIKHGGNLISAHYLREFMRDIQIFSQKNINKLKKFIESHQSLLLTEESMCVKQFLGLTLMALVF